MEEKQEIWLPIKGWDAYYEISNMANVRSLDRIIIKSNGTFHKRKGKILKPVENKNTHFLQVMLICHNNYKLKYLHRLVAEAFVENPNPEEYKYVTHLDGDITNNQADNLKWVSKSLNKNKKLGLY